MSLPKIDAHHHFWRYTPDEYDWIDDSMSSLRRDFLPDDLLRQIQASGINGVISVQARQTVDETRWLLDLASAHDFIQGVVGWIPLTDPNLRNVLNSLRQNVKLKGVRHVLQGEPDERYILRDDFNRGIDLLKEWELVYDILVYERHLPHVIEFVQRHPEQVFVVDHIAKPRIREGVLSPWREHITRLAEFPNVYCKLSGMVTEANHQAWKEQDLQPYFDEVLNAFSPYRLLFGSDWPVCLAATSYQSWLSMVQKQIATLTESEQSAVLGGVAAQVYRLSRLEQ